MDGRNIREKKYDTCEIHTNTIIATSIQNFINTHKSYMVQPIQIHSEGMSSKHLNRRD
jgi:hypothetical protein